MKNTKKLLISVITVALSLLVLVGSVFSAAAADIKFNASALKSYNQNGYGSFDKGIKVDGLTQIYLWFPSVQYGNPNINGHPNLNFELGWQYWVDTPNFEINTETINGKKNSYATVVGSEDYKGIYGVKFTDSRIKAGDNIGVLYSWRNTSHQREVEPKMIQLLYGTNRLNDETTYKDEHQLVHPSAHGYSDITIWIADEEDDKEWNKSFGRVYHSVKEASGDYQPLYYFYLGMQTKKNEDFFVGTDIDDVTLVKHDDATGMLYDLDGNQLYNLNNLPKREDPDYIFGDLSEKDPDAKIKVNVNDLISGKVDLNEGINDTKEEIKNEQTDDSSEGIATWIWIVIAAGVVLLLAAAAVVVIIIIKKKKANVTTEE